MAIILHVFEDVVEDIVEEGGFEEEKAEYVEELAEECIDGDEDACKSARQLALSICVDADIEAWDEQRANGNFLGVQEKPPAAAGHH